MLAIIGICLFSGYRIGNFYHNYQLETLSQQQTRLEQLYQQQDKQLSRINTLEVELEVERLANQQSQALLKSMEQDHYQVKKELAFYEKVMAPEKRADGLVIDSFALWASKSDNHYLYRIVLVQQQLKRSSAKGYVDFSISGSLDNKPTELSLAKVSTKELAKLDFSFQYFQIIEGELELPAGFIPEKVAISATIPKGRWQKYYRIDENYLWSKLVKNDP
ncbi:DUF6776 family protein [Thalassotalea sp. PLHSN55]|uniref:DUF6776 family protein n=1 Tax=Thalassotalea sp. PLHSN55 TaxID=3435888 RepID=UPI003F83F332